MHTYIGTLSQIVILLMFSSTNNITLALRRKPPPPPLKPVSCFPPPLLMLNLLHMDCLINFDTKNIVSFFRFGFGLRAVFGDLHGRCGEERIVNGE